MYILKCILLGSSNIGKSTLMLKFLSGTYSPYYSPTIGIDYGEKVMTYENIKYKLQLWDTAGQERFNSITKTFYRYTQCVIYCFSLANKQSFAKLQTYVNNFRIMMNDNYVVEVLVGLCCDEPPVITQEEINLFKKENGIALTCNVSSKENINVTELFNSIVSHANEHCTLQEAKPIRKIHALEVEMPIKKQESCCTNGEFNKYSEAYYL